jgi:hypothetical protein
MSKKQKVFIELGTSEAAIIFTHDGIKVHYPKENDNAYAIMKNIEYFRFALMRKDWLEEWYDYMNSQDALDDLAESSKPKLRLVQGGKSNDGIGDAE